MGRGRVTSEQPRESLPLKLCIWGETDGGSCEEGEGGENNESRDRGQRNRNNKAGEGEEAENTQAVLV